MSIFSLGFPLFLSFSFSFSLSFLLSTILILFRKSMFHSVLHFDCHCHVSSIEGGGGLVKRPSPHVLLEPVTAKSDPSRRIGFTGGDVDGLLRSCTESLGFESSDERQADDLIKEIDKTNGGDDERRKPTTAMARIGCKKVTDEKKKKKVVKSFPPRLSSLNGNGKPYFSLRPVRKDGRLELFQVRTQPPEILHASREDGWLRLRLVPDGIDYSEEDEDEAEEEEEEEEEGRGLPEKMAETEGKSYEREEEKVEKWKVISRCHEMVGRHHDHHHHRQQCLQMCGVSTV